MSSLMVRAFLIGSYAASSFVLGLYMGKMETGKLLAECQKQHNVYECVIIAIPKGKEGVYDK